jgi:hypothetical protein
MRYILLIATLLLFTLGCEKAKPTVEAQAVQAAQPVAEVVSGDQPVGETQPAVAEEVQQPLDENIVEMLAYMVAHQPVTKRQMQIWLQSHKLPALDCGGSSGSGPDKCKSGGVGIEIYSIRGDYFVGTLDMAAEPKTIRNWYSGLGPVFNRAAVVEHSTDDKDDPDALYVEKYTWTSRANTVCALATHKTCEKWNVVLAERRSDKPNLGVFFLDQVVLQADLRRGLDEQRASR